MKKLDPNFEMSSSDKVITVCAEHVQRAYAQTRPSVSPSEKIEQERAYSKFAGGREANFVPASASDDGNQRTALK